MTDEMMALRALVEKASDADFLRDMIAFAAERMMEIEVGALTGAPLGQKSRDRLVQRKAIATGTGRRAPAQSSCTSPSCGKVRIFRAFSSLGGWRKRR